MIYVRNDRYLITTTNDDDDDDKDDAYEELPSSTNRSHWIGNYLPTYLPTVSV